MMITSTSISRRISNIFSIRVYFSWLLKSTAKLVHQTDTRSQYKKKCQKKCIFLVFFAILRMKWWLFRTHEYIFPIRNTQFVIQHSRWSPRGNRRRRYRWWWDRDRRLGLWACQADANAGDRNRRRLGQAAGGRMSNRTGSIHHQYTVLRASTNPYVG